MPTPRFDGYFVLDTDSDTIDEVHSFYRPPLELAVADRASGRSFRAICVHTKSKINFDEFDRVAAENTSLRNRRKLLAQCLWVRYRVEEFLAEGHEVVVLGDFNDGPGLDYYERRFGRSAIEIAMGDIGQPTGLLRNPHTRPTWKRGAGWEPYTASFSHPLARGRVRALLDFVLVSQGLAGGIPDSAWEIWNDAHPAAREDQLIERALSLASDHFPVTVTLDL